MGFFEKMYKEGAQRTRRVKSCMMMHYSSRTV